MTNEQRAAEPLVPDLQTEPNAERDSELSVKAPSFSEEQLIACDKCGRNNPPTRVACLYCGAVLLVSEDRADLQRPALRRLESWEQGVSVIYLPEATARLAMVQPAPVAELLKLESDDLKLILDAMLPLPLARVELLQEATLVVDRLKSLGLVSVAISDEELGAHLRPAQPSPLRGLDFTSEGIAGHAALGRQMFNVPWSNLQLVVTGRRYLHKLHMREKVGRRNTRSLDQASETSADELLLELFVAGSLAGWRIAANNFDFSCLGQQKTFLAVRNFWLLLDTLRQRAPSAVFDDTYKAVRFALQPAWPSESKEVSTGWRRTMGQSHAEAVATTDNSEQFARYALLRRYFLHKGKV